MADDTRQPAEDLSREALTVDPTQKAFTGTQWQGGKQIPYTPPANANMLAGGTEHTAGGKAPEPTVANALKEMRLEEFTSLHKRPCVRDALLTGIGGGFMLGGVRTIFGAAVWNACSWAVGSFCTFSFAQYQYCYYKRNAEKEGMMRVVEVMQKKEIEKRAREQRREKVKEERRLAKDQELDTKLEGLREAHAADGGGGGKAWWKVW